MISPGLCVNFTRPCHSLHPFRAGPSVKCSSSFPSSRQHTFLHSRNRYQPDVSHRQARQCHQRMPRTIAKAWSSSALGADSDHAETSFARLTIPLALTLALCNMDRIVLSVAMLAIAKEYGFSLTQQGIISSAFLWGYVGTQLLGGTLADRHGGKLVMAYGIVAFSAMSLLMPIVLSQGFKPALAFKLIVASRLGIGMGEGVALPVMNSLIITLPRSLRSTGLGVAFTGFHSGNLLGLAISPMILAKFGWRGLFCIFGILGGPLLAFWQAVVPSRHSEAVQRTAPLGEGEKRGNRLLRLLSSPATWAIIVVNCVNHWGYFIYLNWMPTYFSVIFGLDVRSSSYMSFLPWTVMAIGSTTAGLLADSLVRSGMSVTNVRKLVQTIAFMVPAGALLVLANPNISQSAAVACLTVALGVTSLGQAGFVANMADIAPGSAGQMFGLCGTFASLAGILATSSVGYIVESTGSFDPVFKFTAVLYLIGTLVWNKFCTGEVVFS